MQRFVTILLLTVFAGAMLFAGTTGKISGTVKDSQTGDPIIGATILIEGTRLGAAADVNGYFTILNVPPGNVTITASAVGYHKYTVSNVSVQVDLTSKVDFPLSGEDVKIGEVVVTAQRPVVRKDLTSVEAHVDAEQIKNLPATEVHDVLTLQTGITVDNGGGIHIRGGRSSEVAYWVDGRPITDAYDNGQGVLLSNNSLQELQVVSGTFNAEYGNAMSGIINIVTKDGGTNYSGSINAYSGSYVTNHTDIFYNMGTVRPFSTRNLEGTLDGPVPLTGDIVRFFATGRYYHTDGYLYGFRRFTPAGTLASDSGAVPMNNSDQYTGQGKLTIQIAPTLKLNFGAIGSKHDYRNYSHSWRLLPDGDVNQHERGLDLSGQLTHTLSSNAFYTINASRSYHQYFSYVFPNPLDSGYLVDPMLTNTAADEFIHAGMNLGHFQRHTTTYSLKFDMTDQLTPVHQFKWGVEGDYYRLFLDGYGIVPAVDSTNQPIIPYKPSVLGDTSTTHSYYLRQPRQFSAYVQDKIEYQNVIINFGLRFDYFDPRGLILSDPTDPNILNPFDPLHNYHDLNGNGIIDKAEAIPGNATTLEERLKYWYQPTTSKSQISPRFGIAYPITDKGVIHFSYGHFLQIPSFSWLYDNPDYKVSITNGIQSPFANPDLKPQRTTMYELGLQQQVAEDIGIDVTGYYRDIRDWVTSSVAIVTYIPTVSYTTWVNRDYANVRGVSLSVNKRLSDYYQFNISYTYQVAEGVNSNPIDEFNALNGGGSPVEVLTPLDWDQTHTLNVTAGVGDNNTGLFAIARYGSGLPYTPTTNTATYRGQNATSSLSRNSRNIPANFTIDLRAFRNITYAGKTLTVSMQVFNLLDSKNALGVFSDTGEPDKTLSAANIQRQSSINTVAEFLNDPTRYASPREVQFGLQVGF